MKLNFPVPTPLAYFAALVERDEGLPLLEAAASLAQDEYPELDVQQVLSEVDLLAARLQRRAGLQADALQRLRALGKFFFGELGFAGNVNDYYDPDNSFMHVVLHRRRGIPVSLAVLWLELAQSLGLAVEGVGFPGHFLVRARLDGGQVVIDPLTGQSLGPFELRERIEELHARPRISSGSNMPLALYLRACGPRQMLARMLRNLQEIYRMQQDWLRLVRVQDRLITLLPQDWHEYRDRGLALAELGATERACTDLGVYLRECGNSVDRQAIAERWHALSGR